LAIFSEVRLSSSIGDHFFPEEFQCFCCVHAGSLLSVSTTIYNFQRLLPGLYTSKSYLDVKGMFAWVWRVSMQYISFTTMDSLGAQRKLRSCWTP